MGTFILVHGGWQANWCWERLVPILEGRGCRVIAPSLPGHDPIHFDLTQMTFDAYVSHVCSLLQSQTESVTLVGHSMAGMIISQATEICPDRVKGLVYLAAFLPRSGQSLTDLVKPQMSAPPPFQVSSDGKAAIAIRTLAREKFYADCTEEVAESAMSRLCPQSLAPFGATVRLTQDRFGRIPKTYIKCLNDKSIWPTTQEAMYTATPCDKVLNLKSGHCPFLSSPADLAKVLLE